MHNLKAIQPVPGAVLDVVTVVSNPCRYMSRYRLYRDFEKHMLNSLGVRLTTVECAYGDRAFEITDEDPRVNYVKVRTDSELWLKESMLNVGISRLPLDWTHVAWIDADVVFARPDWALETLHQLQHHPIVQPFSFAMDLGSTYGPLGMNFYGGRRAASWGYCHINGIPEANVDLAKQIKTGKMDVTPAVINEDADGAGDDGYGPDPVQETTYWHPGFAWACTRDCFNAMGGLLDFSILGAGDYLMAASITGHLTLSPWFDPNYSSWILQWKDRASAFIKGDLGYADGLLLHGYHGPKAKRAYKDRWRIFYENAFNPVTDIHYDWQRLWTLSDNKPKLRDDIRKYFRSRGEDIPSNA